MDVIFWIGGVGVPVVVGIVSINYLPTSILGNTHTESHFFWCFFWLRILIGFY